MDLAMELGENTLDVIASAETILVADLTLVAADEALAPSTWTDQNRIAGYPISGDLKPLDTTSAQALRTIVLNGENYDPDLHWRCLMQRAIGFRFVRGGARVEAALTDPCWLWIWTFERGGKPVRWSAAFGESESAQLYRLVRPDVVLE